jgi:hypothetical protein
MHSANQSQITHDIINQGIIENAHATGTHTILTMIQEKYGDIMSSQDTDYHEIAMSFLNLFDAKTAHRIQNSKWFRTMIEYRIPIYRIHEELKAVKYILSKKRPYDDLA